MALDGTYTGLKASVQDFLNRSDTTTIAAIPDFIVLAEAQMARRFVSRSKQGMDIPRRLIGRSDANFSLGMEYIAVPTDFVGPLDLVLTDSSGKVTEVDYIDQQNLQRIKTMGLNGGFYFTQPATGAPMFYTIVGGQIQILPVADQAYTGEMTYIKRIPAAATAINWILTDYPDAYLYGALVQSAPYLKDDARAQVWGTLFTSAIDDICNSDPMPTDKSKLRTDLSVIQLLSRGGVGGYNINSDN